MKRNENHLIWFLAICAIIGFIVLMWSFYMLAVLRLIVFIAIPLGAFFVIRDTPQNKKESIKTTISYLCVASLFATVLGLITLNNTHVYFSNLLFHGKVIIKSVLEESDEGNIFSVRKARFSPSGTVAEVGSQIVYWLFFVMIISSSVLTFKMNNILGKKLDFSKVTSF